MRDRLSATATVLALTAVLATAVGVAQQPSVAPASASPEAGDVRPSWLAPGDPKEYVGSPACQSCHADEYAAWKRALHLQMTKPVGETKVLGDFRSGGRLSQNGRSYRFETKDGRYFVSVGHGEGPPETFEAHYTLGAKRVQGYLSRLPDGRIYVLPVFWNVAQRRWMDWKEITPVPDSDHDLRQIWNVTCFNCHATNLVKHFDIESRTYRTSWTEMGIGCEACHGPGAAHVALARGWEASPASKPAYDRRRTNHELGRTLKIFAPRTAAPREVFDTCAYCHGNKTNYFAGFTAGSRYEDYALPFLASQPPPRDDPQGDYWPDGRPSRFNRPQALMQSGCFAKGGLTCTKCHAAHGSANEFSLKVPITQTDVLCTECHQTLEPRPGTPDAPIDLVANPQAHTHHPAGSAGARCVNCHMGDVNWRLLMRRRDHTFKAPVPELSAMLGIPNACNECHLDRTPEWTATAMDRWWGDGERRGRETTVARAIYDAMAQDVGAMPRLAAIAVDRGISAAMRATAAESLGRLALRARGDESTVPTRSGASQTSFETGAPGVPARRGPSDLSPATTSPPPPEPASDARAGGALTPAIVNALIGTAGDPEPIVRAAAVRALGQLTDVRAIPALAARLVDQARVVRALAAEALANIGVTTLPGKAGEALGRAQDEYARSLSTFGDMPGDYVALGWFELQRRRDAEAKSALDRALTLDPDNPQPRVFLGVIAARREDFDGALKEWRAVRSTHPDYPNIRKLIEEAERRRRK